jgi:hypothetical protein
MFANYRMLAQQMVICADHTLMHKLELAINQASAILINFYRINMHVFLYLRVDLTITQLLGGSEYIQTISNLFHTGNRVTGYQD